jgi:hypothetical protein
MTIPGRIRRSEVRTDDCLWVFRARCTQAELAEEGLCFGREGVEALFGGLIWEVD